MTRLLATLFIVVLAPIPLLAQPAAKDVLSAIPKDASAAIVLRSVQDFRAKGKQLIADLDLPIVVTPDQLVGMALKFLHIEKGVDEKAPVVLAMLPANDAGFNPEMIVLLVPIADRAGILANFRLEREPKDNEVVAIKDDGGFIAPRALMIHGNRLCLGLSAEGLKRIKDQPLNVENSDRKAFGDADILLYLGKHAWPMVWGDFLKQLGNYFDSRRDEEERRVGRQLVNGLQATQHSFLGFRYHEGARLRTSMVLDVKKDTAARALLDLLKAGTNMSNLKGLPDGQALAALGWAGDGSKNGIVTKLLFDDFLEGPLPGVFNSLPVFARTDYPTLAGIAQEVWRRLKGVRVGLYHNENEKELGLFSAVAILDTTDGPGFVKEIRTLARIADLKEADLKLPEVQKLIDVEKLVADLDSPTFRTRQAAATRLMLLGEPALPYLKKAIAKPSTLEQKRRAEDLKKDIDVVVEQRRKEFLLKGMPNTLRPNFTVAPSVEKRAGLPVDVLRVTFNTKDAAFMKYVQQLLGPSWDKLRLVAVGDQVVILLGSDGALLEKTIANLKADKGGLADSKALAGFGKRADAGRTAEMHGSAQGFLGLLAMQWKLPARLFRDPPELTSFALSFEADRLNFDLWVPARELRVMVHAVLPKLN